MCIFLIANNVEHVFKNLLAMCISLVMIKLTFNFAVYIFGVLDK